MRDIKTFFYIIIGLTLGIYLIKSGKIDKASEIISYFGFLLATLSIYYAANQFRSNHDWNRRQLAITSIQEIGKNLGKYTAILNHHFDYIHRGKSNPISVSQIHNKICVTNREGTLKRNNENKLMLSSDEQAKEIKDAIYQVLNSFEYLSIGIHHGVFDEKIITAFLKGQIIKTYWMFRDYITHVNKEMHPEKEGQVWIQFSNLAEDLENKKRTNRREKTG